jgi:PAS domain S-box-containing protein
MVRDVTSRVLAEETLRKMYVAVEQSPLAVVITDVVGNIEYVNSRFTLMNGYSAEEVMGLNPRVLKGDTPPDVYNNLWETLKKGSVWEGDFRNRRKDGSLFWEHDIISPINDEFGTITHYMAIKEDITERRNLEEQLRQSQKMEAVGQLAGGVAHDFNNVMQVIMGNAQLQEMWNQAHGADCRYLEEIFRAVERGASLTRSLLVFSRKQHMEVSCFDLNALVRESQKLVRRLIAEDIEFSMNLQDQELRIKGDAGLVQQILFNLVTNARDAIGGQGHIHISTAAVNVDDAFRQTQGIVAPAGRYVQFTISDNGCGIRDDIKSKIFEPFFTTKEVGKGTGLGLAMIHGTVKQMDGFVVVDSQLGAGTAFNIYIPESDTDDNRKEGSNDQQQDMTGNNELLLLVEDEEAVRDSLSHILELFSYRVLLAANADETLALVNKHGLEIRLAILDIILPGMNGTELAARIRTNCPDLPVLFLSGYSDDVLKSKGINSVYLHKPVHPVQLLQQVRNLLDKYENTKTKEVK